MCIFGADDLMINPYSHTIFSQVYIDVNPAFTVKKICVEELLLWIELWLDRNGVRHTVYPWTSLHS